MFNWLDLMMHPDLKHPIFLLQMKEMKLGGVTDKNYEVLRQEFFRFKRDNLYFRKKIPYMKAQFNLIDIPLSARKAILIVLKKKGEQIAKKCWHPEADFNSCSKENGRVKIIEAHSIQKNKILKSIEVNGHVTTFDRNEIDFRGAKLGKNIASTFLGFCNKHDAIFYPIETEDYIGSEKQNFLYAYRANLVSVHPKIVTSYFTNYGDQWENDIKENNKIFDFGIIDDKYDAILTDTIELSINYPIAVATSFYLDFDFEGNLIPHSDDRMEKVYLTVFPNGEKTFVLISYFREDKHLYEKLASQISKRGKIESDLTVLIAAHCENVYFNPNYFNNHIEQYKNVILELFNQAQFDHVTFDNKGNRLNEISLTPHDYLNNKLGISFFFE
jgi:hypothetical protein